MLSSGWDSKSWMHDVCHSFFHADGGMPVSVLQNSMIFPDPGLQPDNDTKMNHVKKIIAMQMST